MDFVRHIFATDRLLWLIWLGLMVSATLLGCRLIRRMKFRRPRMLHSNEGGAGYTMGVVLTLPLFLLLCGMAFESTFLIIAKIGTVYSAYAGARSTAVWHTMPGGLEEQRVTEAVVSGLAPFAASVGFDPRMNDASPSTLPPYAMTLAENYYRAAQKSADPEKLDRESMEQHYLRVFQRTKIRSTISQRHHGAEIVTMVEYAAPLIIPGIAPFLDDDHRSPWQYVMTAEVRMTLEAPKSRDGTLGIEYQPF